MKTLALSLAITLPLLACARVEDDTTTGGDASADGGASAPTGGSESGGDRSDSGANDQEGPDTAGDPGTSDETPQILPPSGPQSLQQALCKESPSLQPSEFALWGNQEALYVLLSGSQETHLWRKAWPRGDWELVHEEDGQGGWGTAYFAGYDDGSVVGLLRPNCDLSMYDHGTVTLCEAGPSGMPISLNQPGRGFAVNGNTVYANRGSFWERVTQIINIGFGSVWSDATDVVIAGSGSSGVPGRIYAARGGNEEFQLELDVPSAAITALGAGLGTTWASASNGALYAWTGGAWEPRAERLQRCSSQSFHTVAGNDSTLFLATWQGVLALTAGSGPARNLVPLVCGEEASVLDMVVMPSGEMIAGVMHDMHTNPSCSGPQILSWNGAVMQEI